MPNLPKKPILLILPIQVIHNIEISLLPNWQGTQQIRSYQLNKDVLVLSADVVLGKSHLLKWHRKKTL